MEDLTQAELKRKLHYDPETGIFIWNISPARVVKARSIAGCVNDLGYIRIRINYKHIRAHRLVWLYMYGEFPKGHLDHINGIRTDNRLCNLREATRAQNSFNRGRNKNNTSGYKGVRSDNRFNNWVARIGINGKDIYLGSFDSPEEASEAYQAAASKYHGEFYKAE